MISHVLADLEACLPPADYRRAVLRVALVETLGFSREDAADYLSGIRLADLPAARALVDKRWHAILRCRLDRAP